MLFHDIQARTVEALPAVLETLQSRGYRFLSWNGRDFVDPFHADPLTCRSLPPQRVTRGGGGLLGGQSRTPGTCSKECFTEVVNPTLVRGRFSPPIDMCPVELEGSWLGELGGTEETDQHGHLWRLQSLERLSVD